MSGVKDPMELIERLPVIVVAGTRFLAKELADSHGLEQHEWFYVDSVGKMKAIKAEQIMFGRGAEKLDEIKKMVEVSIARKHKVMFGSYPGMPGSSSIGSSNEYEGGTVAELMGKVPPKVDEVPGIHAPADSVPPPPLPEYVAPPVAKPLDKRLKANKVAQSIAPRSVKVTYSLTGSELGKYRFTTPSGAVSHANTLEGIVERVKIEYAPRIVLEEVGE